MTASKRNFIKYGLLSGGTLACGAVAALGAFRVSPLLAGQVKTVCLVAVAIGMAAQGAVLFPTKWESRLMVKPHVMGAGSLILFAGAALLLVMLFAGCTPAVGSAERRGGVSWSTPRINVEAQARCLTPSPALNPTQFNFTAANEQFRGARFALAPLEALKRTCCRDDAKDKADRSPSAALLGFRSLERSPAAQQPRQRYAPGGTKQPLL